MAFNKRSSLNMFMALALLVALVSNVFAARLSYSARYSEGVGGKPGMTSLAQQIEDAHEETILENMNAWSGGRYKASKGRLNIISVAAVAMVQTKTEASGEIQAMRALVCQKLKECAPATP